MIFKRVFTISFILFASFFMSTTSRAFGQVLAVNDGGMMQNVCIRQERFRENSVLVCRPMLVDASILNFITQNRISTVEDYAKWVSKNIIYTKDKVGDEWSSPVETLNRKYGDCEDFAFLHESILRVMGYQPKVLAAGTGGRNHAICVFMVEGRYMWLDNGNLKTTPASSFIGFATFILQNYRCSYLAELNFNQKKQTLLFRAR
ncbi:MAG: transglutaminase-like domain-containing protein [Candidatus Omnitrophota bacterium]